MIFFCVYYGFILLNFAIPAISESYYSIIAPGALKSNRKYNVIVSLHEAAEQAAIRVSIEGPSYNVNHVVYLNAYETVNVEFQMPKLQRANYKLISEGISGINFRNETLLSVFDLAGPKIYVQTDKAIYKPGDEVQFRILFLDEHTKPLQIKEPIRVDIMDGNDNRVKQFKDVTLLKGIYKGKFRLSSHPVMGIWKILAHLSGKYNFSDLKTFDVQNYVLPKFSVYIKMDPHFVVASGELRALIYGKYTFDKYVEGNITANVVESFNGNLIQQKQLLIKGQTDLVFRFDDPQRFERIYGIRLYVFLTERHTGVTHSDSQFIEVHHQQYKINVDIDSIRYRNSRPYSLKVSVEHWNGTRIVDLLTTVRMTHGSKDYRSFLNGNGEAIFEFEHDPLDNHIFTYKDSTYTLPNIYVDENFGKNRTDIYCQLKLKGDKPKLGIPIEVELTSIDNIPYIIYSVVAHAQIIETYNLRLVPNQKTYTIRIMPSIKMVPVAFLYVYYVRNGIFHYDEMKLELPREFENKISVIAPKQVQPGHKVTINLKTQPGSVVGILAVDLGVYLLDPSYDLQREQIMNDLASDLTYLPIHAFVYPGLLSGVVTLTNSHYEYVPSEVHGFIFTALGAVLPDSAQPLKFRTKFPETWIFENYEIKNDITSISLTIPDSITTWRITAFTLNDITGFGIVDKPTDITTIRPFFINLNLPYSVKRGEIVAIPVIVYNYRSQFIDTEIIFYNPNQEFDFMESNIFAGFRNAQEKDSKIKRVVVPANGVESVKFYITPKQVGELNLTLVARNLLTSDAIIQKLKVESEGVRENRNFPLGISVQPGRIIQRYSALTMPDNIVPMSEFITLSVGGNILVPVFKNLNSLLSIPTGCGEQNMVKFAPNILVLNYLRATGQYQKQRELVKNAKANIDIAYQQQLSYRHMNGGFSVYGQWKDDLPSIWLTAYVLRYFIMAGRYFAVEPNILNSGLEFLSQHQKSDGSFEHTGYLFYPAQQNPNAITAFVLMTFLEQQKYAKSYKITLEKGLKYLSDNIELTDDTYALSIMAVTLQMAKHPKVKRIFEKLQLKRQQSSGLIWWTQNDGNPEKDIEITAYILMAIIDSDNHNANDAFASFIWLTQQRNERGGFKSTHDTVVGLEATVKFLEKYDSRMGNNNMKLKFKAKTNENSVIQSGEFTLDDDNGMHLQEKELFKATRFLEIEASGLGQSLLQLSYSYNIMHNGTFKHFHVKVQPKMINSEELTLDICLIYSSLDVKASGQAQTNMIIMEVNFPSGFTSSDEFSDDLLDIEIIERVESNNDETALVLYLGKLTSQQEYCFDIWASKSYEVAKRKPALISVYDYYNISRHDTIFYNI